MKDKRIEEFFELVEFKIKTNNNRIEQLLKKLSDSYSVSTKQKQEYLHVYSM